MVSVGIGDEANYTERGLAFTALKRGERWIVGLAVGHVVAGTWGVSAGFQS